MKIKLKEFFAGHTPSAMRKLGSCEDFKNLATGMRVALEVQKYLDKSEEVQKIYEKKVQPFLSDEKNKDGQPLIKPEMVEEFLDQQEALFEEEIDFEIGVLTIEDFEGCKLSPFDILAVKSIGLLE